MVRPILYCGTAVLMVACIAYWCAQSDIEDSKQRAFVGKACVDAGGQWKHDWGSHYNCLRPASGKEG